MADDKDKTSTRGGSEKASEPPSRSESDPAAERTYSRDRLIAEGSAFLGEEPHVIAGALAGERKQNFTLGEVKAAVKDFRRRPVSTD